MFRHGLFFLQVQWENRHHVRPNVEGGSVRCVPGWTQPARVHQGFGAVPEFFKKDSVYRIIGWFGLDRTFRGHLVQPPCSEQGHLQLGHVAQSPAQPDLECFQR